MYSSLLQKFLIKIFSPFSLILSYNKDAAVSFISSSKPCQTWGTQKKLLSFEEKKVLLLKNHLDKRLIKSKFVKEKSKTSKLKGSKGIIWNCSKGVKIIIK